MERMSIRLPLLHHPVARLGASSRAPVASVVAFVAIATATLSGCGGNAEAEPPHLAGAEPPLVTGTPPAPRAPTPANSVRRSAVADIQTRGLGVFFQNVEVEDYPVMREGRFVGFRLRALNPEWGVDLKPGDVILRVNGMAIEHPEDAQAALKSLEKASALRVDFERDGKARTLELPIVEDGTAAK